MGRFFVQEGGEMGLSNPAVDRGARSGGEDHLMARRSYARFASTTPAIWLFAILAVGPEAGIDRPGYDRAVRTARQRLDRLEKGKKK